MLVFILWSRLAYIMMISVHLLSDFNTLVPCLGMTVGIEELSVPIGPAAVIQTNFIHRHRFPLVCGLLDIPAYAYNTIRCNQCQSLLPKSHCHIDCLNTLL